MNRKNYTLTYMIDSIYPKFKNRRSNGTQIRTKRQQKQKITIYCNERKKRKKGMVFGMEHQFPIKNLLFPFEEETKRNSYTHLQIVNIYNIYRIFCISCICIFDKSIFAPN